MQKQVEASADTLTEEESLALFESTARDLLKLSAAGFLVKYKRGEFSPLENYPTAMRVLQAIPPSLQLTR
ncbi:MAG: hypothetical protein M3Y24_09925 [Acidobacteriota bacterium]|nr:hypothetical protein [Acidobacteriota bacterium]